MRDRAKETYKNRLKGVNEMTNAEITKTVLQIQDKTQASTERSKKLIQETIEVAF
jgi:hypothetical protein